MSHLRFSSRGRGNRTPVNGFGDRRTTAVLFLYVLFPSTNVIIAYLIPQMQD